jgi:hypothetical protein
MWLELGPIEAKFRCLCHRIDRLSFAANAPGLHRGLLRSFLISARHFSACNRVEYPRPSQVEHAAFWIAGNASRFFESPRLALASLGFRIACGLGVGAALSLGLGYLVTSRLTVNTNGGPLVWVMFAPVVIFFAGFAMAAAVSRSFRAGVQAATWTALLGTLLVFAISIPEAMRRYSIDGRTLGDGESGYPIGVNLLDAIFVLAVIPILGLRSE